MKFGRAFLRLFSVCLSALAFPRDGALVVATRRAALAADAPSRRSTAEPTAKSSAVPRGRADRGRSVGAYGEACGPRPSRYPTVTPIAATHHTRAGSSSRTPPAAAPSP